MVKARVAIAVALLAAMTVCAAAQGPSYESRGYGGPLYVGPNFQSGGQNSPPVYGQGSSSKKQYRKRRVERATTERKAPAAKATDTAKSSPKQSDVQSENSSIAGAAADTHKTGEESTAETTKTTNTVENENSSISGASLASDTTAKDEPKAAQKVGCKKYFPTAGMTLSVPCD
jgi:hypothetical protein